MALANENKAPNNDGEIYMKVGFIGLGSMGAGQAMLLANSTHKLTVFDVSPRALAPFEGKATIAKSLAEVAMDADVVGICVRDDSEVNECANELLPVMSADSVLLIHSTVRPATMISLAERAAARKVNVLDAAVTRTILTSEAPFVFCMTGGDETVAERVKPVLDAYSTDTMHVGPHGSAMAMKICNNLVAWCEIMLGLEAFQMAEAAGVPTEKLLTVMKRNGCLTPQMGGMIQIQNSKRAIEPKTRETIVSQSGIGEKDLSLAEDLGAFVGVPTPIGTLVRGLVRSTLKALSER